MDGSGRTHSICDRTVRNVASTPSVDKSTKVPNVPPRIVVVLNASLEFQVKEHSRGSSEKTPGFADPDVSVTDTWSSLRLEPVALQRSLNAFHVMG
jgi:hypothetical protein